MTEPKIKSILAEKKAPTAMFELSTVLAGNLPSLSDRILTPHLPSAP